MGFKIDDMPLNEMMTEDLKKVNDEIIQILEDRRFKKKENAWAKVKDAITAYCKEFGSIEIIGEYENNTIHSTDDFSTIGEISFREF